MLSFMRAQPLEEKCPILWVFWFLSLRFKFQGESIQWAYTGKSALSWQRHILTNICQQWGRRFLGAIIKKGWDGWATGNSQNLVYNFLSFSRVWLPHKIWRQLSNGSNIEFDLCIKMINLIHKIYSKSKQERKEANKGNWFIWSPRVSFALLRRTGWSSGRLGSSRLPGQR